MTTRLVNADDVVRFGGRANFSTSPGSAYEEMIAFCERCFGVRRSVAGALVALTGGVVVSLQALGLFCTVFAWVMW